MHLTSVLQIREPFPLDVEAVKSNCFMQARERRGCREDISQKEGSGQKLPTPTPFRRSKVGSGGDGQEEGGIGSAGHEKANDDMKRYC